MKTSIALGTTQMGLGELAWRQAGRFVAEVRHARARHKAHACLAALDDRTLRDIGIERSELWRAVDAALGDEPPALREARGRHDGRAIAA